MPPEALIQIQLNARLEKLWSAVDKQRRRMEKDIEGL